MRVEIILVKKIIITEIVITPLIKSFILLESFCKNLKYETFDN